MKNNNVLKDSNLLNPDIRRNCDECCYYFRNGCPSDQSPCWVCKDFSQFKPIPRKKSDITFSRSIHSDLDVSKVINGLNTASISLSNVSQCIDDTHLSMELFIAQSRISQAVMVLSNFLCI